MKINDNIKVFADKILELIENKNKRIEFGKNAKEDVIKYNIAEIAEKWNKLFKIPI
jgi:glycosyltransferase involved in cell wall biosynthesis